MKVETNLVRYNTDDLLLACHNLNQIHTHLNTVIKKLPQDEKLLLLTIFDSTHAGEIIKGIINQKKTRKKEVVK